jgi:hypothetical protein
MYVERLDRFELDSKRQAEHDWAELVEVVVELGAAIEAERAQGTEPTNPRMVELARQWRALLDHYTAEVRRADDSRVCQG